MLPLSTDLEIRKPSLKNLAEKYNVYDNVMIEWWSGPSLQMILAAFAVVFISESFKQSPWLLDLFSGRVMSNSSLISNSSAASMSEA